MRFGFHTGYWAAGPPTGAAEAVVAADRLGFDSVWTAESYGSDALTPLAWWGAATSRVRLGTGIMQMSARTPTATAMAALTMDHLSGGRFVLGLGASGPQVVEGWYGQPYPKPLARTREYVDIVRQVLRREGPVTYSGAHYELPLDGGAHQGKPLRSTVHPLRADLPIHLAAQGPKNTALAAEIADGWLPAFVSPKLDAAYREHLDEGFAARSPELTPSSSFEVCASVPVALGPDLETAADHIRPHLALYIGGMGSATTNFHRDAIERLGYRAECAEVQRRYAAGDKAGAAAAIPIELVLDVALVGPPAAIREQLVAWESSVVTTLILQTDPRLLPALADVLGLAAP
ncbi:LLM class F420-dependent oxidoreductase [Occultella glacieicola]|uniref:LLM class F420-dependent oxidoreductase n=1 Tax=Occultella glacieicola TaxID=2518684 RepID=A0ABY2E9P6_9MICO|nr:LLM class F420-dependent oxidoreductase [Occultella glacieicola]TDE98661.1 LLM class F420-dependent oxidoreductase [Occultella glacieicola]